MRPPWHTLDVFRRQGNLARITLWMLVAIGFALRIARVHEYGLHPDESQFLWVALARTWTELWHWGTVESPHPLANVVLLHLITRVSRDLLWLRLPSVLAGTFLIWISHRFARELFGRAAGLAMAVLVTFSPGLIDLSSVCRNYAPGLALLVAALWFLARFLHDGRWRDLRLFALMELLAATWVFSFAIVFAAMNLTLAVAFLRQRAGIRSWAKAALYQLPLVALLGLLYVTQVSRLPPATVTFHHMIYGKELSLSLHAPLEPLRGVWQYLMPAALSEPLLWLSLVGLVGLVARGEHSKALLFASPVVLAYGAMWARQMPLGNTRHGVYLFPFLFGLVASLVPELRRGFAPRSPRRVALVAGAVLAVAAATYVGAALLDYGRPAAFEELPLGHGRELLTYYRQEDVSRSFELLEQGAGPNDVVMMSIVGVLELRTHLATCLTPEEESRDTPWSFPPLTPMRYGHRGVMFYMSGAGGMMFTAEGFVRAVRDIRARYGLANVSRVWAIRSAIESSLTEDFRRRYPEVAVDLDVDRASNGWLFAVDAASLANVKIR